MHAPDALGEAQVRLDQRHALQRRLLQIETARAIPSQEVFELSQALFAAHATQVEHFDGQGESNVESLLWLRALLELEASRQTGVPAADEPPCGLKGQKLHGFVEH